MMESLCLRTGIHGIITPISLNAGGGDARTGTTNPSKVRPASPKKPASSLLSSSSRFSFKYPLRYLWPGSEQRCSITIDDAILVEKADGLFGEDGGKLEERQNQGNNWVLKILHAKSLRESEKEDGGGGVGVAAVDEELGKKKENGIAVNNGDNDEKRDGSTDDDDDENCDVCRIDDDDKEVEDEIKFDRDLFSSLLKKVSMADAKLYAKLSYLGKLTYSISKIQPENLLRYYQLRFITSSLEKKEQLDNAEKGQAAGEVQEGKVKEAVKEEQNNFGYQINASVAYQITASAASYLYSQTKSILPFKSSEENLCDDLPNGDSCCIESVDLLNSEMASFIATTDSMTAVVGAKEDVKQAVADDLNSLHSSPCEWFICDDDLSGTRFFVIQGSESLASWQANLLFEPVQFEGFDVLVHRGIYEAARGIYEQMLPEVRAHLRSHGDRATMRFTGHSLGGSLALLVNLMLLIRGEVPVSSLLPVIAFGAPYVMCGGDHLLHQLGLPRNHFQAIAMHRDIVPRAFSSLLSNHIVELIKAVNGKFRTHACLNNQKLLFAPMGELLILQPDVKFSPHHHLLPPGNGLYLLTGPISGGSDAEKLTQAATKVFLNSPHPLEILSDRAAYGSEGTIIRDHDMNSYLKSIRSVIRQDLNRIRKAKREHRRKIWWPLVRSSSISSSVIVGQQHMTPSSNIGQRQFNFSGILQTGRDSFKRFSRLVASQHMHLLVVLLFPARLLLFETFTISLH